jgi:hypothetical protein
LYGSSLQLDDGWISCARTLLSLLLRCLDVASAPPITILNSAVDLGGGGGGGATGRYGGGEGSGGNREDVFELRLGLRRCEQD